MNRAGYPGAEVHFDNLLSSGLVIFQMFTLDEWTESMFLVRKSTKTSNFDGFFMLVVYVGAFFVVNLVTAIQFYYYNNLKSVRKLKDTKK
jgi:hypothetical protein